MVYFSKFQEKSFFIPDTILQQYTFLLIRNRLGCPKIPNNNIHILWDWVSKDCSFLKKNLTTGHGGKNVNQRYFVRGV